MTKINLSRFGEIGFVILAALVFSWGLSICTQEPAEDFALVITSIYDATFYFPGSNRLGNLVGLLSSGVSEPVKNYHLQVIIRMAFSLLWPYLACCLILPRRLRLTTTLLYHGVVLSQFSYTAIHVLYSSNHPYSTSLFLLLAASLFAKQFFLRKGKHFTVQLATAGVLILLSSWVNPTTTVYAFLAFFIYGFLRVAPWVFGTRVSPVEGKSYREMYLVAKHSYSVRRLGSVASIFLFALVASVLHARIYAGLFPEAVRSFSSQSYLQPFFSLAGISDSFSNLFQAVGGITFAIEVFVVSITIICLLLYARMNRNPDDLTHLRIGLAVVIAGLPFVVAFSQLQHMATNGYHPRYFLYFPMFTVFVGCCVVVTVLERYFSAHLGSVKIWFNSIFYIGLAALSMSFFAYAGIRQFGFPVQVCEFSKPDSAYANNGHYAFSQGYFGLVGSYWDIWPATFHAWREAFSAGVQSRVYPTGYRAEVLAPRIIPDATSRLMAGEKLRLLCINQGKTGTEFGKIDCEELVRWNQAWGVLPQIGQKISVMPISGYSHLHEIVMELPGVPRIVEGGTIGLTTADQPLVLHSGWSQPETFGTWTEESIARIAFIFECTSDSDLHIRVNIAQWIGGFIPAPPNMVVDVLMNGKKVSEWRFSALEGNFSPVVVVPRKIVNCGSTNEIQLSVNLPHSPKELGFNPADNRRLGVAIRSLSFY